MDGLAASLATVSCAVFAVAALDQDSGELALVVALALGGACLGFLPFNLRPGRSARVFMGDSGSQVIGFGLASLALASSWTTAGATLTSIVLPLLVLAIPILDTTLVTVRRTLERRPVTQGGTDHSSHRLVYYGLSEQQAVAALTLLAALLGATALAYNVLANARVTAVGVLISFVVLVQFASFLGDLQERSRREDPGPAPAALARVPLQPAPPRRGARRTSRSSASRSWRRICSSSTAAARTPSAALFLATLPILLGVRYVLFVALRDLPADLALRLGARPARDRRRGRAVGAAHDRNRPRDPPVRRLPARGLLRRRVALHDARRGVAARRCVCCPVSRTVRASRSSASSSSAPAAPGRALARELAETPETRVVGFVDDNPALRRRRIHGVTVHGALDDVDGLLGDLQVDEVLVTIPEAASERLELLVASCTDAGVGCRFVVREIAPPPFLTRVPAE